MIHTKVRLLGFLNFSPTQHRICHLILSGIQIASNRSALLHVIIHSVIKGSEH